MLKKVSELCNVHWDKTITTATTLKVERKTAQVYSNACYHHSRALKLSLLPNFSSRAPTFVLPPHIILLILLLLPLYIYDVQLSRFQNNTFRIIFSQVSQKHFCKVAWCNDYFGMQHSILLFMEIEFLK